jgi:hypothetical protein
MKVAVHQAEHLPWLGFFYKMYLSDIFVLLDHVKFTKNNFQNRNRVKDCKGNIHWLTIPIESKNLTSKSIREIKVGDRNLWQFKYLESIRHFYSGTEYFNTIFPQIKLIVSQNDLSLFEINMKLIKEFRKYLGINTPIVFSSELSLTTKKSEMLLEICNKLNADTYLSGLGGKAYLNVETFQTNNMRLDYIDASMILAKSEHQNTILSSLDSIMNFGSSITNDWSKID